MSASSEAVASAAATPFLKHDDGYGSSHSPTGQYEAASDLPRKSRRRDRSKFSKFVSRFVCCFNRSGEGGTSPLLDVAAMLKSLLAAVSILHMIDNDRILNSEDADMNACAGDGSCPVVVPKWLLLQQCQPSLQIGNQVYIFTVFLICNQITFAVTSFLIHVNPLRILRHSYVRVFCAYFLGLCSFVFGFCKIILLASIPANAVISFTCFEQEPNMESNRCNNVQTIIPGKIFGVPDFIATDYCAAYFRPALPVEVYLLSITFALTFVYSIFMCDIVLHHGESGTLKRLKKAGRKDVDSDADSDSDFEENDVAEEKSLEVKKALHSSDEAMTVEAVPLHHVSDSLEINVPSDEVSPSTSIRSSVTRASKKSNRRTLVNGLDPFLEHRIAAEAARSLSAHELLVCQIVSAHKKQVADSMKSHQILYRMLRDLATLTKFIITIVSLCLLLYNVSNSIVQCDANASPQDIVAGVTSNTIFQNCEPQLASYTDSFYFAAAGALVGAVFIFIITLEKKVLVPSYSASMSAVCLIIVVVLLALQLLLMIDIDKTPLVFPCHFQSEVTGIQNKSELFYLTESGMCIDISMNITGLQSNPVYVDVDCADRCYASLGASSYTLFASLVLTLVYMASLTWQYHRLARAVVHSQNNSENRLRNQRQEAKSIVMDIMEKSYS